MLVNTIDGKRVKWVPKCKKKKKCSKEHARARELLNEMFQTVIEEVTIPVKARGKLYLDFYIPLYKMAVEVHGQQHYEFSSLFHKDKMDFFRGQSKDRDKKEWCEINNITLIELPYNEKTDEWRKRIECGR